MSKEYFSGGISVIKASLFLSLVFAVAATCIPSPASGDEGSTLVVMIDHSASGFAYRVSGRDAGPDFLTYLNKHYAEFPPGKTKVILLVHQQATLAVINNSRGMIMKAGYEQPRVFQFNDDKRAMIEITFLPAVPFSAKGPG
jgi:hypothetical protein